MTNSLEPSSKDEETLIDPILTENKPICKVTKAKNASNKRPSRHGFRDDQKLKELLASADEIKSLEHFLYWKDEFLADFGKYLDPEETANAREADEKLYTRMQKLAKVCLQLKDFCDDGNINHEGCSVKGRRALNEFIADLASAEKLLHEYFPKTLEDEEKVKYNKFNLAAVLVRDGFRVYGLMTNARDYIVSLMAKEMNSDEVLKPNHKSIIQFYFKEVDSFCDCLADLGMYKLMEKCVELFKIRPRTRKKKPFDRKTMGPLSDTDDGEVLNGGRMFRRSKQNFKSIMDHGWTSGVTRKSVVGPSEYEQGEDIASALDVPANEDEPDPTNPNEWIFYYDPTTEMIGKIPRKKAMADGFIIKRDKGGKEEYEEAVTEWDGPDGKIDLIWKLKNACKGREGKQSKKK